MVIIVGAMERPRYTVLNQHGVKPFLTAQSMARRKSSITTNHVSRTNSQGPSLLLRLADNHQQSLQDCTRSAGCFKATTRGLRRRWPITPTYVFFRIPPCACANQNGLRRLGPSNLWADFPTMHRGQCRNTRLTH
jgi:hypothetical protein